MLSERSAADLKLHQAVSTDPLETIIITKIILKIYKKHPSSDTEDWRQGGSWIMACFVVCTWWINTSTSDRHYVIQRNNTAKRWGGPGLNQHEGL